jgi:phosphohistidine phosphatase SixA
MHRMLVLLVRHGHAGTKRRSGRKDILRPLNEQGLAEADALAPLLALYKPLRIISSPLLRCVQSVTPLAHALGVTVRESPSLVPDAGAAATILALNVAFNGSGTVVLCTHGEVIHDMQARLGPDGPSNFNPDAPREKASVWLLERKERQFVSATYLSPPTVRPERPERGEAGSSGS